MELNIISNPSYTDSIDIGLELSPDDEVLRLFLAAIGKEHLLALLVSISESRGFTIENARLSFFSELDWEDKESLAYLGGIKKDQIYIYNYDGQQNETIVDEVIFKKILKTYMSAFIDCYSTELDDSMIDKIRILKQKKF